MRILSIAPPEVAVPPKGYGGTELVIHNLVEEQVKRGHEVYLLASGDSKTSAHLIPIVPKYLWAKYPPFPSNQKWLDVLRLTVIPEILLQIQRIKPDIVHNHYSWRGVLFSPFIEQPTIHTMHHPLILPEERYVFEKQPDENYVSISDNQRKAMPDLNWVRTIYNGIDTSKFDLPRPKKGEYFAFLGRISPEKGLKEIIQMIRKTPYRLKIAAKIDNAEIPYYEKEVKPLIDGKQIEYIGEIGAEQKSHFLARAQALLLWLSWEEPFGLVVTEAMAAGTPVIVNTRGAMPELLIPRKTGFLVNTLEEMQRALEKVADIKVEDCRQHVRNNFSVQKMADDYLALAEELVNK